MDRIIIIDDDGIQNDLNDFLEANKKNIRLNSDILDLSTGKNSLLKEIIHRYEEKHKLKIKAREHVYLFKVNEIAYLRGTLNKTEIHLESGETIMLEGFLGDYADNFKAFPFLNVHTDYIVNINFLTKIVDEPEPFLVLQDKVEIPVSAYHKNSIIRELEKYI